MTTITPVYTKNLTDPIDAEMEDRVASKQPPKVVWDCMPYEYVGPFPAGTHIDDMTLELDEIPRRAPYEYETVVKYLYRDTGLLVFVIKGTERVETVIVLPHSRYRLACDGVQISGSFTKLVDRWAELGNQVEMTRPPMHQLLPGLSVILPEGRKTIDGAQLKLLSS